MSIESELESIIRMSPAGGHSDVRRTITDVPAGYLHGANIGVANIIQVSEQSNGLPLGQHFHTNYGEIFAVVHGKGTLYARAVVPGEKNRLKSEIIVPENMPLYTLDQKLYGSETKIPVDSKDPSKMIVRVVPGIAHTFVLEPGSVLIPFLVDAPKDFNPHDKSNYVPFPLV